MPRGFKLAIEATNLARKHGIFKDKRSFYGFKVEAPNRIHRLLHGKDKSAQRQLIYDRDGGMCKLCPVPHFVNWDEGEWHHIKNVPGERCDCTHNGAWACKTAHKKQHVHTRFGEHRDA